MRKQCEIVQDLLPLYIDGMLKQGTEEFVKEHLFGCAQCKLVKNQLQNAHFWKPDYNIGGVQPKKGEAEFIERIRSYKRRSAAFFVLLLFLFSLGFWFIGKIFQDDTSVNKPSAEQKTSFYTSWNLNRD